MRKNLPTMTADSKNKIDKHAQNSRGMGYLENLEQEAANSPALWVVVVPVATAGCYFRVCQ